MLSDREARWLRRLSFIPRWSVVPITRPQSVAEHSFHVSTLALWLCGWHARRYHGNFVHAVMVYAHTHDIEEAKHGDHPSPTKPFKTPNKEDQVKVLVKCADVLEAIQKVYEEALTGNKIAEAYIPDELHERLRPWWDAFQWDNSMMLDIGIEGKPSLEEIVEAAKKQVFDPENPHPAVEKEECYPIKFYG